MKYVIVTIEWCLSKGIVIPSEARKSTDKNSIILHYEFIKPVLTDKDIINLYTYDSIELDTILDSSEWTLSELDT